MKRWLCWNQKMKKRRIILQLVWAFLLYLWASEMLLQHLSDWWLFTSSFWVVVFVFPPCCTCMKLLLFIYVQRKVLSGCGLYNHNMGLLFLFIWCEKWLPWCQQDWQGMQAESVLGRNHVGPKTQTVLQIMVFVSDLILNRNLFVVPNTVLISEPRSL